MIVSDTIRKELHKRFPTADFSSYFSFLKSLPVVTKGNKHHILPQKEFPAFIKHPENIVMVSYPDHFKAHYWLASCAPECGSFQQTIWFMVNYKARDIVSAEELIKIAEIYERGKEYQRKVITAMWDEPMRAKQSLVAKRVNERENFKLTDFVCPNCDTEFKQITKSVYAGHRRFCLNYSDNPISDRPFVIPTDEITKCCGKCGSEKLLTEFNVERKARLGRANYCRLCAHRHRKEGARTNPLRDYTCSNCEKEFKQVKPGVFGGHRRSCLNYSIKRKEFMSWKGSAQAFANKHGLPFQTVWRWKNQINK